MAWTTPRTWTTGELVTAALLNSHLRDNLNVVNPTETTITFDGGGAAITTGSFMDLGSFAFSMTISRWEIYTTEASSIQWEIVSVSYGGWPSSASAADSINSGSPIKTASARKGQDTNPSAFATIAQGEVATLYCTANSAVTKGAISLWFART